MQVVDAIIRNQSGEFLLQLRDDKAPSFKNCWTLFGGRVELGETPVEALLRELNEELKLQPNMIESIQQVQVNQGDNSVEQAIYEIMTTATLDQLTLGEGAAMEYAPQSALFDYMFGFNIKEALQRYLY